MSEQVEFRCPHCDQLYRLGVDQLARYVGRVTHCRRCHEAFSFPELPGQEPASEAAPQEQIASDSSAGGMEALGSGVPDAGDTAACEVTAESPVTQAPAAPPAPAPARPLPSRAPSSLGGYLGMRVSAVRTVAQLVFWLGTLFCVAGGIALLAPALRSEGPANPFRLILGAALIVLGPLVLRLVCEVALLVQRIERRSSERGQE